MDNRFCLIRQNNEELGRHPNRLMELPWKGSAGLTPGCGFNSHAYRHDAHWNQRSDLQRALA